MIHGQHKYLIYAIFKGYTMHFQGLHYGPNHDKLRDFPDNFIADLAGNAFEVRAITFPKSMYTLGLPPHLNWKRPFDVLCLVGSTSL